MWSESELLYGQDLLDRTCSISRVELRRQLAASLSHRLVLLRSLCCSPALERYTPEYTTYYAQKLCLFGLRAIALMRGDFDTRRRHVLSQALAGSNLSDDCRAIVEELLGRLHEQDHPGATIEKLQLLDGTIRILEEAQSRVESQGLDSGDTVLLPVIPGTFVGRRHD
jgi:hypothetical protein